MHDGVLTPAELPTPPSVRDLYATAEWLSVPAGELCLAP
jgi:hypothetical protein